MKLLHLSDLHKNPQRFHDVELSLDVAEKTAREEKVDLIILAGDLYDGAEQNSELGLHTPYARRIQRLGNIAPVAIVQGTVTHDIPGSLDIFEELACEFGITILKPGEMYFLMPGMISTQPRGAQAILFGLPEPGRSWIASRTKEDGKAKTADEINAELKMLTSQLLLGYGAKRREYPDLPCVFIYHGQVRGCRLSNGTTLPDGQVSADDLRQVGFDYGALGDIHEPQRIRGLPAFYSGSIYTEWGEYHKAGCNLVEIATSPPWTENRVTVCRVDFPHPQKVKIQRSIGDGWMYSDHEVEIAGKQVWEEWTVSKEGAGAFDAQSELEFLLETCGAVEGSRVTLNILPTETMRAGEIAKKETLAEKVALQGENSSTPYPASVLEKAAEIEAEIGSLAGFSGPERRFRTISTRLRGSRGFWSKQKKDEVCIEWDSYGEGVIPFVGPNGFGKTTAYDFSKPWPVPVSRGPKTLKAHFMLKDSAIENIYLEEVSGVYYRTLINIDGANKSGDAKYFFYRGQDAAGPWAPYSEEAASGRLDPFSVAINEVFGSMAIYMRTAFLASKATKDFPDIADAVQSEKKQLIAELVGKDYSPYRDAARARSEILDSDIARLDMKIDAVESVADSLPGKKAELATREKEVTETAAEMKILEEAGKLAKEAANKASVAVSEAFNAVMVASRAGADISTAEWAIEETRREIEGYRLAAEKRPEAEMIVLEYEATAKAIGALLLEKSGVDQKNHEALKDYQETTREIRSKQDQAREELDDARRTLAQLGHTAAIMAARIKSEDFDTCPTCGQLLPEEKRAVLKEAHDADVRAAQDAAAALAKQDLIVNSKADALRAIIFPPEPEPTPFEKQKALDDLAADLSFMKPKEKLARRILEAAQMAAIRSEEARRRIDTKSQEIVALRPSADSLAEASRVHDLANSTLEEKKAELENARKLYQEKRDINTSASTAVMLLSHAITDAEKIIQEAADARSIRDEKAKENAEWQTLERAIDGVRDLELDALAPSIAEVATKLLQGSGREGCIEIDTTRTSSGSMKKARQIEDFLIFHVKDSGER